MGRMTSVQHITYPMIINFLSPNQAVSKNGENFPTKENIIVNTNDFPKKIRRFFNKNFFRYGILTYDDNHNNISFYSSLLSCLDSNFLTINTRNKISYVNFFKKKIKDDFINKKLFKKFNYSSSNISEKILLNEISSKISLIVIQAIVDYLEINIILFNFDDLKRYTIHSGEVFNMYYPTLLFGYSNGYYEPIFNSKKKIFTNNDKVIKKIFKNNIYKMSNTDENLVTNKDIYHMINDIIKDGKNNTNNTNNINNINNTN